MTGETGVTGPVAGRLLVSTPALVDPNFARTIVLLLNVDADGSLGVVLNRPSTIPVGEVLDGWAPVVAQPDVIFRGGPVETDSALGVASLRDQPLSETLPEDPIGWRQLFGGVGLVDLDTPTEIIGSAVDGMRIYAGYAGWSSDQLDAEIAEGSWIVVPAEPADLFAVDPSALWHRVLSRQGGELSLMATMPSDPTLN